jgi:collagenase-like PrtC family protease
MTATSPSALQLTLGPVLYHWAPEVWRDFYFRMADEAPLDRVVVETLDGVGFLTMNGVQTQARACTSLIADLDAVAAAGASALRLSPQQGDMVQVAQAFRDVADGVCAPAEGQRHLAEAYPGAVFSNGFLHGEAGVRWKAAG